MELKLLLTSKCLAASVFIGGSLCWGNIAQAQFVHTAGSTVTTTTDNVGINVATPDAKLSILSGYYNTGCVSWSGQPALKVEWQVPDYYCPFGPISGSRPNMIEIFNKYTLGGPAIISPYLWMDYAGNLGLGTYPVAGNRFSVSGNSLVNGELQAGSTGLGTAPVSGNRLTVSGNSQLNGNLQVGNLPVPPGARMAVDGEIAITNTSPGAWRKITANTTQGGLNLVANTSTNDGSAIELYGTAASGREGEVRLISYGDKTGSGGGIQFMNYDPGTLNWVANMRVFSNGKVSIGNLQPSGSYAADYKLGVDGTIICKRAVVQNSSWADFVFASDYNLPSLESVEQYILKNKHLPDVPSEKVVLENGVDIGDMNKILLQKVEELTLYMIEMKKENQLLKAAIDRLDK